MNEFQWGGRPARHWRELVSAPLIGRGYLFYRGTLPDIRARQAIYFSLEFGQCMTSGGRDARPIGLDR
jgi:hypothetical protein